MAKKKRPSSRPKSGPSAIGAASGRRVSGLNAAAVAILVMGTLAWIPGGFSRFTFAKLLCCCLAFSIAALAAPSGRLPRQIWYLLVPGAGVFVLAAVLGETPQASLIGRWPRYEGLPVLCIYTACAWLGARAFDPTRRNLASLHRPMAIMSLTLFVFTLAETIGLRPLGESNLTRAGSLLGNATDQGLVAMMATLVLLPPALDAWGRWRDSWSILVLLALAGSALTVILSGSRASLLALTLTLIGLALARRKALLVPVTVGVLVLAVISFVVPQMRDRLLTGQTVFGRGLQWRLTLNLVADHPLFGIGPSRYVDAFGSYETPAWIEWAGPTNPPDSPHSWLLQALVAGGVPLLLLAVAVAGVIAWKGWLSAMAPEGVPLWGVYGAVLAYGMALSVNFTAAGSTCLAAMLGGVLLSEPLTVVNRGRWMDIDLRRVGLAAGLAGCAFTAFGSLAEISLQQGVTAASHGDLTGATAAFQLASRQRPYDPDTAMIAAQSLAGLAGAVGSVTDAGRPAEAAARSSLRGTPETYASLVALGVALLQQDRLAEAEVVLDNAIAHFPERSAAFVQRGIARFGSRDVAGARSDLERASEINPRDKTAARILKQIDRRLQDG